MDDMSEENEGKRSPPPSPSPSPLPPSNDIGIDTGVNGKNATKDESIQGTQLSPRSIGLFLYALVTCALSSGLPFGWPALRRHFIVAEEKQWDEERMSIIFIAGAWSNLGSRLLFGLVRDRTILRTKGTACLSLATCIIGILSLAFANSLVGISLAMFLVGTGQGVQVAMQPVANLFPQSQGVLLSSFAGAFQISSLGFLVLLSISKNRVFCFSAYAAVLGVVLLVGSIMLPLGSFTSPQEKTSSRETGSNDADENSVTATRTKAPTTSLSAQLRSQEYMLLVFWFSAQLLPMQYYVATIGYQLEQRGDITGRYTNLSVIVFASSSLSAPIAGYISDKLGLGVGQGLSILLVAVSYCLLASRSLSLSVQVVGMLLNSIGRLAHFGMFFTNVGVRFGYDNYGILTGVGMVIGGVVSLLQYPMIKFATTDGNTTFGLHGDSLVDLASAGLGLLLLPYCAWLSFQERSQRRP